MLVMSVILETEVLLLFLKHSPGISKTQVKFLHFISKITIKVFQCKQKTTKRCVTESVSHRQHEPFDPHTFPNFIGETGTEDRACSRQSL